MNDNLCYKSTALGKLDIACKYLFDLNRFAKNRECANYLRQNIYDVKNQLIRLLYLEGYCVSSYVHTLTVPYFCDHCGYDKTIKTETETECSTCDGTGDFVGDEHCICELTEENSFCEECGGVYSEFCKDCEGSGVIVEFDNENCSYCSDTSTDEKEWIVFNFLINGSKYCWHQPKETVFFKVEEMEEEGEINPTRESGISLKEKEAKDYLKYIEATIKTIELAERKL